MYPHEISHFAKANKNDARETAWTADTHSDRLIDLKPVGRATYASGWTYSSECTCRRSKVTVLCRSCGHMMFGRVRHQCPIHPRIVFLMDIVQCLQCQAHAFMLDETR